MVSHWSKRTWGGQYWFVLEFVVQYHGQPRQEFKTGTQKQELKQRPWRTTAYWFAPPWLDKLLFLDDMARDNTANCGLGPHIPVNNQENALLTRSQFDLLEAAPQLRVFLPRCSCLRGQASWSVSWECGLHSFPLDTTWVQENRTFRLDAQTPAWASEEDVCWVEQCC